MYQIESGLDASRLDVGPIELPAERFVFVTGYAGEKSIEQQIADWGVPVITKPFKLSRLSEVCFPFLVNTSPPRQLDLLDPTPMGDVIL